MKFLPITRRIGGIVLPLVLIVAVFSPASRASMHTKWVANANHACQLEKTEFSAVPRYTGTRASMVASLPKLTAIRVRLAARLRTVAPARSDQQIVTDLYHYFALDIAELQHVTSGLRSGSTTLTAAVLRKINGYETSEAVLLRALHTTCGQV